ncbi:periaxin [Striga asiatica]|uniref:Periaxin n=1 Tax=Striga asiatica TaxID=4170 RepID=A0A5A7RCH2_STRAF|nr:periaxin [Striga asiatica]
MDRDWVNELVQFAYQYIHDHAPQLAGEGDGWVLVGVNGQENPRRAAAAEEGDARREPAIEREMRTADVLAEQEEDGPRLQYPPDEDGDLYGPIFASDSQPSAAAGAPAGTDLQPSYAVPLLIPAAGDGSEIAVAARSVMGTGKWVAEDEPETSSAAADRKGKAKVVDDEDDETEAEAKVPTETDKSKSDQVNTQTEILAHAMSFPYVPPPNMTVPDLSNMTMPGVPDNALPIPTVPNATVPEMSNITMPDGPTMTLPGPLMPNPTTGPAGPNVSMPDLSNMTVPDMSNMTVSSLPRINTLPSPTTGPTMPAGPNATVPSVPNIVLPSTTGQNTTVPLVPNMTVQGVPIMTLPGRDSENEDRA